MMFQGDDPFHYILEQKIASIGSQNKNVSNIKLNLNKLPRDFFQPHVARKPNTLSQRLSSNRTTHVNQFLAYNKTVELKRERKPTSFMRGNSRILESLQKRELTAEERKRPEKRRFTEVKEQDLKIFNGTFAKKMYSQASEERKRHLPALDSARKYQKLTIEHIQ